MDDNSSDGKPFDMDVIQKELPYGTIVQPVDVRIPGGLIVGTGTRLGGMGDSPSKEDMTVVVACVTVGYDDQ